jgi:hypothetical protein
MISTRGNRTLSDLAHAHIGRAAVVIGGAPCLLSDLRSIEATEQYANAVFLAGNDHAFKLGAFMPKQIDYVVACDDKMRKQLQLLGRPIIAPRHWADYRVLHQPVSNSGALACVAAWAMGCAPIIVTGCELFGGDTYFHDAKAKSSGKTITVDRHLERWALLTGYSRHAMMRAVSGPLLGLFQKFDPAEATEPIASLAEILVIARGVKVEIVQDVPNWHGTSYARGQIVELRHHEAGELISRRWGKRFAGGATCLA